MSGIADGIHPRPPVSTDSSPAGPAGGDLSGTYPDPEIGAEVITDAHISPNADIAAGKIDLSASDLPYSPATQIFRSGLYYPPPYTVPSTTNSPGNGSLRAAPFIITQPFTADRIRIDVTTAGGAGSLCRLGIYSDDSTGYPGAVLLDAGTVDATTTGLKSITISQALTPGIYWVAMATQGAPSPTPFYMANEATAPLIGYSTLTPFALNNYAQSGQTGAFPANFTTTVTPSNTMPVVFLRIV